MMDGDIITAKEVDYVSALETLWDMLSDTIEGGRLTEDQVPDDYDAFIFQMKNCETARDTITEELES